MMPKGNYKAIVITGNRYNSYRYNRDRLYINFENLDWMENWNWKIGNFGPTGFHFLYEFGASFDQHDPFSWSNLFWSSLVHLDQLAPVLVQLDRMLDKPDGFPQEVSRPHTHTHRTSLNLQRMNHVSEYLDASAVEHRYNDHGCNDFRL